MTWEFAPEAGSITGCDLGATIVVQMDEGGISHKNLQLDALLGAAVVAGAELDHSEPDFIFVVCRCEDADHALIVLREPQGAGYVGRKIMQFYEHPCLGQRIKKGGE